MGTTVYPITGRNAILKKGDVMSFVKPIHKEWFIDIFTVNTVLTIAIKLIYSIDTIICNGLEMQYILQLRARYSHVMKCKGLQVCFQWTQYIFVTFA